MHKGRVVTGDEVRRFQQVGRLNPVGREPQMRHGDAAGLFGIVGKICLREHIRIFTDDLDGVLVGAYGSVGPQAPEFAAHRSFGRGIKLFGPFREVKVTSSTIPTVKWFLGPLERRLSKTAFAMEGVKSLLPRPYRPPTTS